MAELNVRVYVVEVPGKSALHGNLPFHPFDTSKGCCIYAAESAIHDMYNASWVGVHTTEDHTEAIKVAKEYPRARVKQFWLARTITVRDTLSKSPPNAIIPDASMIDLTCMDHPEVKLRWMPDGNHPPTCGICHKHLVTQDLIDAMANPVDLSET